MRKQCEAGVLKAIPSLKNSGNIFENFFLVKERCFLLNEHMKNCENRVLCFFLMDLCL